MVGSNKLVGVYFTDHLNLGLEHEFFRKVIYGIERKMGIDGYDILYFTNNRWENKIDLKKHCEERGVDGIILIGIAKNNPNLMDLINSDLPTVFVDVDIVGKNATNVTSDNVNGAREAINYLYSLGHRDIGMIMGYLTTRPTQERLIGYQTALNEHNLSYRAKWVVNGNFSKEGGCQAMKELLKGDEKPTAVFCQSDKMAIGAIEAINETGFSVPEDISIIGFDNIDIAEYYNPPITTIAQDHHKLGNTAAVLLEKIMNYKGDFFNPEIIPTKLIIRKSCQKIKK